MAQAISIQDGYVYPDLVWGVYVERVEAPRGGRESDETKIAHILPRAETCLGALAALSDGPWLAGPELTLADLHAAPMFALFLQTPEGVEMMVRHPRLAAWWAAVSARPSFLDTAP